MRVVRDPTLALAWLGGKPQPPAIHGTFIAKATFAMVPDGVCTVEDEALPVSGDLRFDDDPARSIRYPSDFAPYKPLADVLLAGTAHAPGGVPTDHVEVSMRVGSLLKRLHVVGNRTWHRGLLRGTHAGDAHIFTSMPLCYERAYGGPTADLNPLGVGRKTDDMPNIEAWDHVATSPDEHLEPAGFGPIDAAWPQRKQYIGTYDHTWLARRWPWRPDDFDYRYFNAAPHDQRIDGYLVGREEIELHDLHAAHPQLRTRLPSLRARVFVEDRFEGDVPEFEVVGRYREVALNLDTLFIDTDDLTVTLVWRGTIDVDNLRLRGIETVFGMLESLDGPTLDLDGARLELEQRLRDDDVDFEEMDEEEFTREGEVFAQMDADFAQMDKEFEELAAGSESAEEDHRSAMLQYGMTPPVLPVPGEPQSADDAIAEVGTAQGPLREANPDVPFETPESDGAAEMALMDQEAAAFDVGGPDDPTREDVIEAAARGTSLAETTLADLDLSGLDLSGVDFREAQLADANLEGANLSRANLSGAGLSGANLTNANLTSARLDDADLTDAVVVGTVFREALLSDADLSGLTLSDADFSGCEADGANFSECNLAGASFRKANFSACLFIEAILERTDFTEATLVECTLHGVRAEGILADGSTLNGMRATDGACFARGSFVDVVGANTVWEGADLREAKFDGSELDRSDFTTCILTDASLDRCQLRGAIFEESLLERTLLTNANLLRASFDRARLVRTDLRGANAYEAGFEEVELDEPIIEWTNLKGTILLR